MSESNLRSREAASTTELTLQPNELRSAAKDLADVSSRMKGVMSRLAANLAAEGAPWGGDDSGRKFRHGDNDNGYDSQKKWVDDSVDAKAELLDNYSEALRTTADTLEGTDSA